MKLLLGVAVAMLALLGLGGGSNYQKAHATTYVTEEATIEGPVNCSATAVGPHALLTASHCEQPTSEIALLNQSTGAEIDAHIKSVLRDNADHTIYILDATFPEWARLDADLPQQTDDLFFYGNPGQLVDIFEKGYVMAVVPASQGGLFEPAHPAIVLISPQVVYGDSGAAVFNKDGKIITVVTGVREEKVKDMTVLYSYGYGLQFTKEQLSQLE